MKRAAPGFLLINASLPALAHEGHGVDIGSAMHYVSGPHLLVPIGVGLCIAGACYVGLRYLRQRR